MKRLALILCLPLVACNSVQNVGNQGRSDASPGDRAGDSDVVPPGPFPAGEEFCFPGERVGQQRVSGTWCWESPSPHANTYYDAWGTSANDIWFASHNAMATHWDGVALSSYYVETGAALFAVHGSATDDVWMVGDDGAATHWDGDSWSRHDVETGLELNAVWSFSPTNAWAVGEGIVAHWDGSAWEDTVLNPDEEYFAIWGNSPAEIWLGGSDGALYRGDGDTWLPVASGTSNAIRDFYQQADGTLWAIAHGYSYGYDDSDLLKWSGSAWNSQRAIANQRIRHIWGDVSGRVFTWSTLPGGANSIIERQNGSEWIIADTVEVSPYQAVFQAPGDDAWFAGNLGRMARWNEATGLSAVSTFVNAVDEDYGSALLGVWGSSSSDIWAVGRLGFIAHYDGSVWSPVASNVEVDLNAVWGRNANEVWFAGDDGNLLRWDGDSIATSDSGTTADLRSLTGTDVDNLWFITSQAEVVRRWDGGQWINYTIDGATRMTTIWGSSDDNVWASGRYGTTFQWDGIEWTRRSPGYNGDVHALWGTGADNVWAAGDMSADDGRIMAHFDGTEWHRHAVYNGNKVLSIWGSSADDVWAVGAGMMHWDGTEWRPQRRGTNFDMLAVWGSSPDKIWAVGEWGAIVRYEPLE